MIGPTTWRHQPRLDALPKSFILLLISSPDSDLALASKRRKPHKKLLDTRLASFIGPFLDTFTKAAPCHASSPYQEHLSCECWILLHSQA